MAERLDSPELLSLALDVAYISDQECDDIPALVASVERRRQLADRIHAVHRPRRHLLHGGPGVLGAGTPARRAGGVRGGRATGGRARRRRAGLAVDGGHVADAAGRLGRRARAPSHDRRALRRFSRPASCACCGRRPSTCWPLAAIAPRRRRCGECSWARRCGSATARSAWRRRGGWRRRSTSRERRSRATASASGWRPTCELLRAAGRWDELAAACAGIRERAARIDWLAGPPLADRGEAAIALAHGDAAAAEAAARRSCEGFAAIGAEWEAAVSALDLAEALRELARPPQAREVLEAAAPALRRAGALAELDRLQALGADLPTG